MVAEQNALPCSLQTTFLARQLNACIICLAAQLSLLEVWCQVKQSLLGTNLPTRSQQLGSAGHMEQINQAVLLCFMFYARFEVEENLLEDQEMQQYNLEKYQPVLYCYELQLDPEVHRKGLGKRLMQMLELLVRSHDHRRDGSLKPFHSIVPMHAVDLIVLHSQRCRVRMQMQW